MHEPTTVGREPAAIDEVPRHALASAPPAIRTEPPAIRHEPPTRAPRTAPPIRAQAPGPQVVAAAPPFEAALSSVLFSPDRQLAIIDGRVVGRGDAVRDAIVIEISDGVVLLRDAQGRLRRLSTGGAGR